MSASREARFPYLHSTLRQALLCTLAAPVLYLLADGTAVLSLLCGAACLLLPQAWFALRMQRAATRSAARAARMGMAAEAGKFVLSAAAFAVVFAAVKPGQPPLVFAGYGAMWLVQLWDGVRLLRQPQR